MKQKLIPLLGIAFVVALISTGIFYGLFVGRARNAESVRPHFTVVVATHALPRGAVIQPADIKSISWPGKEAPKGSFTTPDQVAGVMILDPVAANEPLIERHVASHRAIPSGMRAVSIHVTDSSGVVAMLHPANKVDIQVLSEPARGEASLRTALQNVEVLTVSPLEGGKPVVTLLVSPEDAEILGLADSASRIRLVLRNPADDGRSPQPVVSVSSIFKQSSTTAPQPAKASGNPKLTTLIPR